MLESGLQKSPDSLKFSKLTMLSIHNCAAYHHAKLGVWSQHVMAGFDDKDIGL